MKKSIIMVLFCLPFLIFASEKTKVKFYKGALKADLKEVKKLAKESGKGYILDFEATWCSPCRWMNETTYNDPILADFMAKNYIAVKVDIDDIEGFELKEKYKVEVLPTIIAFDANGKQIARYNESLGANKLMEGLKKARPEVPPSIITREKLKPETEAPNKITEVKEKITSKLKPTEVKDSKTKKSRTYAPGVGLYKLDISRQVNSGFTIQVLSLGQYDNVMKKMEELKGQYSKPILLNVEPEKGKTSYKIMIGEFKTREEAEKFKKAKKMEGFIKDLDSF